MSEDVFPVASILGVFGVEAAQTFLSKWLARTHLLPTQPAQRFYSNLYTNYDHNASTSLLLELPL